MARAPAVVRKQCFSGAPPCCARPSKACAKDSDSAPVAGSPASPYRTGPRPHRHPADRDGRAPTDVRLPMMKSYFTLPSTSDQGTPARPAAQVGKEQLAATYLAEVFEPLRVGRLPIRIRRAHTGKSLLRVDQRSPQQLPGLSHPRVVGKDFGGKEPVRSPNGRLGQAPLGSCSLLPSVRGTPGDAGAGSHARKARQLARSRAWIPSMKSLCRRGS